MTREEAIEVIKQDIPCENDTDLIEALEMVISALEKIPKYRKKYKRWKRKALEQKPCEDAVSREAVRNCFNGFVKMDKDTLPYVEDYLKTVMQRINELPSVTRQTGKWEDLHRCWICSECGKQTHIEHNFCPNCGAKMESEE